MSQIRTGQIGTAGDAWLTWTPTLTGFSANPTNSVYRYLQVGKTVFVAVNQGINGTSNATTFTITLPVTAATITNMQWVSVIAQSVDNSVVNTSPALVTIASGATTMSIFKDAAGDAWTASGGKRVAGLYITYEAA